MTFFETFGKAVWNPEFWLPPNVTWDEYGPSKCGEGHRIAQVQDLLYAWKLVPFLLLLKYFIERHAFRKVAAWAGMKEKLRKKPPHIDILEKAHRSNPNGKWSELQLTAFSKQLDLSTEEIKQWFRAKKNLGKATTIEKFCESSWRCLFFSTIFAYGLHAHWDKEWFWDFKVCWENFPQPVSEDLYWYFIISLTNYASWSISHFWDVQRKDPGIMMFHHFVTLTLLSGQWLVGFHRVGLLICLIHDLGDFCIEFSKCLKYLGLKITCQLMFICFTVVWIITRNIIFPMYLLPTVFYHSPHNVSDSFPFSCLNGPCDISTFKITSTHILLSVAYSLSLLHVYWTGLIFKVLYMALFVGKLEDDTVSSDSDGEVNEDVKK